VTYASGSGKKGMTSIDLGRYGEIIVNDEHGGFVAGSERVRDERRWWWAVVIDVQGRVKSHSIAGICANPRIGLIRTGLIATTIRLGEGPDTGGSGERAYGERK